MSISATKLAYARGVVNYLQQQGVTNFSNPTQMRDAAEYVCTKVAFEDTFAQDDNGQLFNYAVPTASVSKVAAALIELNNALNARGVKTASTRGAIIQNEQDAIGDLVYSVKSAMMGTVVVDGDSSQNNSLVNSAQAEAQLELSRRPVGFANAHGRLGSAVPNYPQAARVGLEMPHPLQQSFAGATSNHMTNNSYAPGMGESKTANTLDYLRKLAEGSAVADGDSSQQNSLSDSTQAEAILEAQRRPTNLYNDGLGSAVAVLPQSMHVGTEMPHPAQPTHAGAAANEMTAASAGSDSDKVAQQQQVFQSLVRHLPSRMSPEEKIAAAQRIINMPVHQRAAYAQELQAHYGA